MMSGKLVKRLTACGNMEVERKQEINNEPACLMTREEFTELFSEEMTARGFVIVEKYANCITFYHNSKPAIEDWLVLRYRGKKDGKEWVATEDEDKRFFKFQVQDHETYNLDWDWNNNCTSLEFVIGETVMTVFVDDVVKAAGKYI